MVLNGMEGVEIAFNMLVEILGEMRLSFAADHGKYSIWRECVGIEPTAEGPLLPPDLKYGRDTRPDPPPCL